MEKNLFFTEYQRQIISETNNENSVDKVENKMENIMKTILQIESSTGALVHT